MTTTYTYDILDVLRTAKRNAKDILGDWNQIPISLIFENPAVVLDKIITKKEEVGFLLTDLTTSKFDWYITHDAEVNNRIMITKTTIYDKPEDATRIATVNPDDTSSKKVIWNIYLDENDKEENSIQILCNPTKVIANGKESIRKPYVQGVMNVSPGNVNNRVLVGSHTRFDRIESTVQTDFKTALADTNANIKSNIDATNLTENRKFTFQDDIVASMRFYNTWLTYLYFLLVIILILVFLSKHSYSYGTIAIIAIVFIVYPFVIDYLEYMIYNWIRYLYALLLGQVYTDL